ncbi:tetratricopeptide (TPR) repeat protein [Saccharopolyspora phatthalungensis]|uniref:Tetratricopeptide (TPR) repeat protein n=2 Tax=Saccharopolyspora phatthalungensis TaxID=664693 RepID=A0A840QH78_9PSEU|nr:tetratricopeptide (TPR) repeat protein [Saccharopolyspora phatthalungensis]
MVRSRDFAALPETTEALSRIVETIPPNDPQRSAAVNNLGNAMHLWFEAHGSAADLDDAIKYYREALDSARRNDRQRPLYWSNLALALFKQGRRSRRAELVEEAIVAFRQALQLSSRGSHQRVATLVQLADALWLHAELGGTETDEAVGVLHEAAADAPVDLPDRPMLLLRAGTTLLNCFSRDDDLEKLNTAVQLLYSAAEALPAGADSRLAICRLGIALRLRFDENGDPDDLRDAVDVLCHAAGESPHGEGILATLLFNLAGAAVEHFDCTTDRTALDQAIQVIDRSVDRLRAGDHRFASVLLAVSELQRRRFALTRDGRTLDVAVDFAAKAASCTDAPNEVRCCALRVFVSCLLCRFEHAGSDDDLARADAALAELERLAPADGPMRLGCWMQRGQLAMREHEHLHAKTALNTAITMYQRVLAAMPAEDPERAAVSLELGNALRRQSKQNRRRTYRLAYTTLRAAAQLRTAPAAARMRAAALAGRLAAETGRWEEAATMFKLAMGLFPMVTRFGPAPDAAQQHELSALLADTVACAVHDGTPKRAVELLEHGRNLLLARVGGAADEHAALAQEHPNIAADLQRVRRQLDYLPDNLLAAAVRRKAVHRQRRLADEWEQLVDEVRRRPGFGQYLEPTAFEQLSGAAAEGPVVLLNVSAYGSHALLVTAGEAVGLTLPNLDIRSTAKHTRLLLEANSAADVWAVLDWLWRSVAAPVFNVLSYYHVTAYGRVPAENQRWPRIWWCPTGPAAFLPLHAAGLEALPGRGRSVLERTVPSYTATLRSLLRARQADFPAGTARDPRVVLGNHATAHDEARLVARRWPATKVIELTESTRPTVLTTLTGPGPVHFACQGTQQAHDCSSSRLVGADDSPLALADLARLRGSAEFGYLSANEVTVAQGHPPCSITQLLPLLHHVAGFKHVIGPLWPIEDDTTIVEALYAELDDQAGLNPANAAEALHRTVREMRRLHPHDPRLWAAHVHVGP